MARSISFPFARTFAEPDQDVWGWGPVKLLVEAVRVDYLHRVQRKLGAHFPASYEIAPDDGTPFDEENDKVPDRLQSPLKK
jgi:hypothetical protein